MEQGRPSSERLPDNQNNQTNSGAEYAETDKTEPLAERRSEANNFFAVLLLAVPVLLALMAIVFFSGMQGKRTAENTDREASIKPTPVPTLVAPVNDAGAASRP